MTEPAEADAGKGLNGGSAVWLSCLICVGFDTSTTTKPKASAASSAIVPDGAASQTGALSENCDSNAGDFG